MSSSEIAVQSYEGDELTRRVRELLEPFTGTKFTGETRRAMLKVLTENFTLQERSRIHLNFL